MVTPPRVVSGPTLLTGIYFCADCGGAMTLRTSGKGEQYRYSSCSIAARQGQTGCKGRSVPTAKLDDLVASHPCSLFLKPDRRTLDAQAMEVGDMRKCPHCAEIIRAEAKVCRFCGRDIVRQPDPEIENAEAQVRRLREELRA